MITIILAAGSGERFSNEGYLCPKPMTMVDGEPMIVKVIKSCAIQNPAIIITNRIHRKWRIGEVVRAAGYDFFSIVELGGTTRGPAETLFMGMDGVDENESVLVLDCDVLHPSSIYDIAKKSDTSSVFCFDEYGQDPIFSYVSCDENNFVIKIKEKEKISNSACTGAYFFSNAGRLKRACNEVILNGISSKGEYYMSDVLTFLIDCGEKIKMHSYSPYDCVGTPSQLREFCYTKLNSLKGIRICFDIDGTLMSFPSCPGDYSTVEPIQDNIDFLKTAKSRGAYIILYTARRMKTHNGNIEKVIKDISDITIKKINEFNIPYDEIIFGKPWAHFYIDDLAVPAWGEIDKWTGIYEESVPSRKNNIVNIKKDHVVKTTSNDGEIFWYKNMSKNISKYFPKIFEIKENTIIMEKLHGECASRIFANCNMNFLLLEKILQSLSEIHNSVFTNDKLNVCLNYAPKMLIRMNNYDYDKIGISNIAKKYVKIMNDYCDSGMWKCGIIHGDPVFSNIFAGKEIKFIDPRGKQGENLSLWGDVFYDYSKLYQSLCGYDCIILKKEIPQNADQLKEEFMSWISRIHGPEYCKIIKQISTGLIISLIPIHDDNNVIKFVDMIKKIDSEI
jgi:capsule biosynthesis phosphatase